MIKALGQTKHLLATKNTLCTRIWCHNVLMPEPRDLSDDSNEAFAFDFSFDEKQNTIEIAAEDIVETTELSEVLPPAKWSDNAFRLPTKVQPALPSVKPLPPMPIAQMSPLSLNETSLNEALDKPSFTAPALKERALDKPSFNESVLDAPVKTSADAPESASASLDAPRKPNSFTKRMLKAIGLAQPEVETEQEPTLAPAKTWHQKLGLEKSPQASPSLTKAQATSKVVENNAEELSSESAESPEPVEMSAQVQSPEPVEMSSLTQEPSEEANNDLKNQGESDPTLEAGPTLQPESNKAESQKARKDRKWFHWFKKPETETEDDVDIDIEDILIEPQLEDINVSDMLNESRVVPIKPNADVSELQEALKQFEQEVVDMPTEEPAVKNLKQKIQQFLDAKKIERASNANLAKERKEAQLILKQEKDAARKEQQAAEKIVRDEAKAVLDAQKAEQREVKALEDANKRAQKASEKEANDLAKQAAKAEKERIKQEQVAEKVNLDKIKIKPTKEAEEPEASTTVVHVQEEVKTSFLEKLGLSKRDGRILTETEKEHRKEKKKKKDVVIIKPEEEGLSNIKRSKQTNQKTSPKFLQVIGLAPPEDVQSKAEKAELKSLKEKAKKEVKEKHKAPKKENAKPEKSKKTAGERPATLGKDSKKTKDVIGLDIGSSTLRATLLQEGVPVFQAEHALKRGIIVDGLLNDSAAFSQELKKFWEEAKLPSRSVSFSLANRHVALRTMNLAVENSDDLPLAVEMNADTVLAPMDPQESFIDFAELSRQGPSVSLQVVAADKEMVHGFSKAIKRAGLTPVSSEIGPVAAGRSLRIPRYTDGGVHCLIDIGAETTSFICASSGDVYFLKIIEIGGNDFTDSLTRLGITFEEAEDLKKRTGFGIEPFDLGLKDDPLFIEAQEAMLPVADRLYQEIMQTRQAYEQRTDGRPVRGISIIGGGAELPGLRQQLPIYTGFPASSDALAHPNVEHVDFSKYAVSIGLSQGYTMSLLDENKKGVFGSMGQTRASKVSHEESRKQAKKLIAAAGKPDQIGSGTLSFLMIVLALAGPWYYGNMIKEDITTQRTELSTQRETRRAKEVNGKVPSYTQANGRLDPLATVIASHSNLEKLSEIDALLANLGATSYQIQDQDGVLSVDFAGEQDVEEVIAKFKTIGVDAYLPETYDPALTTGINLELELR